MAKSPLTITQYEKLRHERDTAVAERDDAIATLVLLRSDLQAFGLKNTGNPAEDESVVSFVQRLKESHEAMTSVNTANVDRISQQRKHIADLERRHASGDEQPLFVQFPDLEQK
jgi:hypothetical protein